VPAAVFVAAVAAVLAPRSVVFVDTARGAVLRSVELPGEGLAIFAAPDGRVVVPLEGEDATAVVSTAGKVEPWRGRVFPLFCVDDDRMFVVFPNMLATLSYPERLPLMRVPLEGVPAIRRAACSQDGRLVAVIPALPGARVLLIAATIEGGTVRSVQLAGEATHVVLAEDGVVAVAAGGTAVEAVVLGDAQARPALTTGGEVRSLCLGANGRDVLVGLARGDAGEVVGFRVKAKSGQPLKERFRTPLPAPVVAIAATDEEVAAISGEVLVLLAKGGRRIVRRLGLRGARDVTVLPARPSSPLPAWSDATKP
jgi:hypothetical protein